MANENVDPADLQPEDVVVDPADVSGQEPETIESLTEKNKQLFARAKKAEGFELIDGKWVKKAAPAQPEPTVKTVNADLSGKDILALTANSVTDEEDVDWLTKEVAPLYGGSVTKALGNKLVKEMLEARREERQTAAASSTGNARRVQIENTGTDILNNAKKGIMPDTSDGVRTLVRKRIGIEK